MNTIKATKITGSHTQGFDTSVFNIFVEVTNGFPNNKQGVVVNYDGRPSTEELLNEIVDKYRPAWEELSDK
jgi:hypothetical protein